MARDLCQRHYWETYRVRHKNRRDPRNDARRAERIKAAFVESVSLFELYERDQGRCGLCGLDVAWNPGGNGNYDPSIDHVIPLVEGGPHSYANTQLAHRVCNSRKGSSTEERHARC